MPQDGVRGMGTRFAFPEPRGAVHAWAARLDTDVTSAPASGAREVRMILMATDFSSAAEAAYRTAVEMADVRGTALTVLHVVDDPGLEELSELLRLDVADAQALLLESRRERLQSFIEGDGTISSSGVRTRLVHGHPFEEIVKQAIQLEAELIVLGTAGRSADLERALFGSTAERVLRTAPCQVLAVPG